VLGLFHPRPLPNHVSTILTMLSEQFNLIANQVKRESFAENYEVT
jgi:hypothetical protein